jgi:hypothetical protein
VVGCRLGVDRVSGIATQCRLHGESRLNECWL